VRRLSILARLAVLALVAVVAACAEHIEGGAVCPDLCPTENVPVTDTVLDAVSLDTALVGYPIPGEPAYLLLAVRPRPDTLDVRTIVRFDTLPHRYFPTGAADSVAITRVDSGYITLHVDTTSLQLAQPTTIEAFDVDTTNDVDSTTAALNKLFRADRLLGARTITRDSVTGDSIRVRISNTAIAAHARDSLRFRVGLRLSSAGPARIRVVSSQAGTAPNPVRLSFDPVSAGDTTYAPIVINPTSTTPSELTLAAGLRDFTIVAAGALQQSGADLLVGGLPGRRSFLRFNVPSRFVDSATIVRATLEMVQRPLPGVEATDTVQVEAAVVLAVQSVTDLRRAADLSAPGAAFGIDSLRVSPADSGLRTLSLVNLVRAWRSLPSTTQRALVLRARLEGAQASAVRLFSTEAGATLRPRLHLSYIPRTEFALP
jgi:hypothetical protein